MTESIIVALITGGLSLVGVYMANRKSQVLVEYKLDELKKEVDKNTKAVENSLEKQHVLEKRADVLEERIKVANNRISDLERIS